LESTSEVKTSYFSAILSLFFSNLIRHDHHIYIHFHRGRAIGIASIRKCFLILIFLQFVTSKYFFTNSITSISAILGLSFVFNQNILNFFLKGFSDLILDTSPLIDISKSKNPKNSNCSSDSSILDFSAKVN